jgi:4-alpha-glucanotransferase
VSTLAVIPVQDVLGLDSDARMNTPSIPGGNWTWRLHSKALTPELAEKLALLTAVTDRDACVKTPSDVKGQNVSDTSTDFAA